MNIMRRVLVSGVAAVALVALSSSVAGAFVVAGGVAPPTSAGASTGSPRYTGPTPDLAKIANNLWHRAQSVTTVISVPSGLTLAEPVNISVGYGNGARITQGYAPATGNRIVYDYPAGDQRAHQQDVWITLSEPKAGGGLWTLALNWQPLITPLYTVNVSPLTFTMTLSCVNFGDNSIDLWWTNPASVDGGSKFTIGQSDSVTVAEFGGSWSHVSYSSNLYMPGNIGYAVDDTGAPFGIGSLARTPLVPGATTHVGYPLANANSGDATCGAWVQYSLTYTLELYPTL